MVNDEQQPSETPLQKKIRASLKKHPLPGVSPEFRQDNIPRGRVARYKLIAEELGCSTGAVCYVEHIDRCVQIGQERREAEAKATIEPPQPCNINELVTDFPGWVMAFGKLSLVIASYLQIARVSGATMPASWLEKLRDVTEQAQLRCQEQEKLNQIWPNGAPAGGGNFGHLLNG